MTESTSVLTDTTCMAVSVHARSAAFQGKVQAHLPVAALIPLLQEHLAAVAGDGDIHEYLTATGVEWALEYGPLRQRIDPELTLDAAGVKPGQDLFLTHRRATEEFPILRDDIAEGAADVSKRLSATLSARDTRRLGAATLPLVVAAVSLIGCGSVILGGAPSRWAVVAVLTALTLMCGSLAAILAHSHEGFDDVSAALSGATYIAAASAAVVGVPRELGVWHLTTAGAACAAIAVILGSATGNRPAGLHVGVGGVSFCAVIVGAAHLVYPVSPQAAAAQMLTLSLGMILCGPFIARTVARVRVNYIPTTGEPVTDRRTHTIKEVSRRSTSAVAIESVLNREKHVVAALEVLIGVHAAAAATLVVSAFVAGLHTASYEWWMFALTAAACLSAVAVGRGYVPRAAAIPLLISGPVAWIAYLTGRAVADARASDIVLIAGAVPLIIAVVIAAVWAIRQQGMYSPLSKWRLEAIATLATLVVVPMLVMVMGLWAAIRNR